MLKSFIRRTKAQLRSSRQYQALDPAVFLVSFPKCGRTWLHFMMGHYLVEHFGLEHDALIRLQRLHQLRPEIPIIYTKHDDKPDKRRPEELRRTRDEFGRHRVIFLVRDPRDVVVSKFYSMRYREKRFDGDVSSFIRQERGSLATIVAYYNIWHSQRRKPGDYMMVRYEDIHAHTAMELYRVLRFVGLPEIDEGRIHAAVSFGTFDNMRQLEEAGRYDASLLRPGVAGDVRSYKTRKGHIGGYRDELGPADIAYIEDYVERHLDPVFGYGGRRPGPRAA